MTIKNFFARWRRSKGYGVHSPLAFRIVTECVRPPRGYAFYADDIIDAKFSGMPAEKKFARMYIRLENLIYPARLTYIADMDDLSKSAPDIMARDEYTLIMPFRIDVSAIDNLLPDATLVISGRRFTVLARRTGMARVSYSVL